MTQHAAKTKRRNNIVTTRGQKLVNTTTHAAEEYERNFVRRVK